MKNKRWLLLGRNKKAYDDEMVDDEIGEHFDQVKGHIVQASQEESEGKVKTNKNRWYRPLYVSL